MSSFVFENTIYQTLIKQYPDWNSLRQYLESEEGGSFRIVDADILNDLCLIRYEKGISNMNLSHSKWFRSVVWNTCLHRPVCVAPPKASSDAFPYTTCQEVIDNMVCEEQHDGVMINCFRVAGDAQLYITSRSTLYATGHFYSSSSFRKLFIETYLNLNPTEYDATTLHHMIQIDKTMIAPNVAEHEYAVYYSFLLQHMDHRIVTKIEHNRVYLIQKGTVYQDGLVRIEDSPHTVYPSYSPASFLPSDTHLLKDWMAPFFQSYEFQGFVFKDAVGNRWRIRSDKYVMIKSLRGNQPNALERFAQLYVQNLTHIYLEYYSEDAFSFAFFQGCLNTMYSMVYQYYVELHITKTRQLHDTEHPINKMYFPHLYAIHGLYLLKKKAIRREDIQIYFMKQPWQRIAFLLRKINDMYFSMIQGAIAL